MEPLSTENQILSEPASRIESVLVFTPGQLVYTQLPGQPAAPMALAEITGIEPGGGRINLQWLASSIPEQGWLEPGMPCRFSTGEKRLLFVADGVVETLIPGSPGGITASIAKLCAGYNRRRHPRYELTAHILLEHLADGHELAPVDPVRVDLSLGGFGLRTADPGWPAGAAVRFRLDLDSVESPNGLSVAPSLRLQGGALLRRRVEQPGGVVLLGFEFNDMSGYRESVLQFWLDTFHVYLRER
jgi:hypothetical protein